MSLDLSIKLVCRQTGSEILGENFQSLGGSSPKGA